MVTHAAPGLNWLWRSEAIGAKRWRCIRNAFKGIHAIGDAATHLAIPCLDNCIHWYTSFKACGSSWSHIRGHGMRMAGGMGRTKKALSFCSHGRAGRKV